MVCACLNFLYSLLNKGQGKNSAQAAVTLNAYILQHLDYNFHIHGLIIDDQDLRQSL